MKVSDKPWWSRNKLARLGEALVAGDPPPAGCPNYSEAMEWHGELAAQVAHEVVAAALIDRLVHHAEVLTIAGDSYRTKTRRDLINNDQ